MPASLAIQHIDPEALSSELAATIVCLCDAAYGCSTQTMFADLGPGHHLLGRTDGALVTHLMWITRWLQPAGQPPLRTAYVEMVATHPVHQRRGHATRLLQELVRYLSEYQLAALCPATEGLYHRVGWRSWQGPLFARKDGQVLPTPDERVMILATCRTPDLNLASPLSVEWRPGEVW